MKSLKNFNNATKRKKWLEKKIKHRLEHIGQFYFPESAVENRNCENLIGAVQVPLGIAGPVKIKIPAFAKATAGRQNSAFAKATAGRQNSRLRQGYGGQTKIPPSPPAGGFGRTSKEYYLPLATTEGALAASVNRGCKATRLCGGISVFVEEAGATRGPVFRTENIKQGLDFKNWLKANFSFLQKKAGQTSSHLTLKDYQINMIAGYAYVRFVFNTCEAMGMNMVTKATNALVQLIKEETGVKCVSLSGNFCVDKKPCWLNFILGRGKKVWAEAVIKKEVVGKVLKTTPEAIREVVKVKCHLGSMMSGSLGFNSHYANIVSALFLATGQDMAHVAEASLGITDAEVSSNNDLRFSVYLPDLMIGTVGGGTHLPSQKEALSILGLDKGRKGDALRLAEIIGAAVLAGELSLAAALSSGDLVEAHERLGKGK